MVETKKFYRSTQDRQIMGVCGGIAEYFKLDSTVVRVGAVILIFITEGLIILAYIIAGVIMPERPDKKSITANSDSTKASLEEPTATDRTETGNKIANYLGIGLVILGAWLLFKQFMPELFDWDWRYVWPAVLIVLGLWIVIGMKGRK